MNVDISALNLLQKIGTDFIAFVPKLIMTIAILIIGWLIANIVRKGIKSLLEKTPIDSLTDKINEIEIIQKTNFKIVPSLILPKIAYYIIILFSLVAAADSLSMAAISNLVTGIIAFIPQLLVAAIVLLIGIFIADFIKDIIVTICTSLGIPSANMIGGFVFWFIFLTALVSAMTQAGIQTDFIMSNLSLLLGGGVFAFALGYGIASKDMMSNFLASFYSKDKVKIGDVITIGSVKGAVIDIDNNSILVQTEDRRVFIPLQKLVNENLEIHD